VGALNELLEQSEKPIRTQLQNQIHQTKINPKEENSTNHYDSCAIDFFPTRPGNLPQLQPNIDEELLDMRPFEVF
jgi:hypothetical protein